MDSRTKETKEKPSTHPELKSLSKPSHSNSNSSKRSQPLSCYSSSHSDPSKPASKNWSEIENCLKEIDKNSELMPKIRNSPTHIESLKKLVQLYAQITGIKEEYEIQTRKDEIVYLFKTGKNEWEFFKLFDELLENCGKFISGQKCENLETSESEAKMIKEFKEEAKARQSAKLLLESKKTEAEKAAEVLVSELVTIKIKKALGKVNEKFKEIDMKAIETDKQVISVAKSLKKMKEIVDKKFQEIRKVESHIEPKALIALPFKRRRYSIVESYSRPKYREIKSPSDSSESKSDESFNSYQELTKENDVDHMIYKLRMRGGVKMTDIWRLNNFAVIFNLNELKSILDVAKVDELNRMRPWASRWKAKDKYFSSMKKVISPSLNRNITSKYENSLAGVTACLTENYLFHFDLYCTWRKLKLWLKDINNQIDLCITPSYPHKIRSVIASENETGFAALLEKALPYVTKQRLERTPNLILYSFIDDYPDDYLVKSQFCIIARNQQFDLRKILNLSNVAASSKQI